MAKGVAVGGAAKGVTKGVLEDVVKLVLDCAIVDADATVFRRRLRYRLSGTPLLELPAVHELLRKGDLVIHLLAELLQLRQLARHHQGSLEARAPMLQRAPHARARAPFAQQSDGRTTRPHRTGRPVPLW